MTTESTIPEPMSPADHEALSALLDGELGGDEQARLLARLSMEDSAEAAALRARWRRYHAVRSALAGQASTVIDAGFAGRVHEAIAAQAEDDARADAMPTSAGEARVHRLARPAAPSCRVVVGLALAAALALIAVGGLWGLAYWPMQEGATPLARSQPQSPQVAPGSRPRQRLALFVRRHNQVSGVSAMPSVMAYGRVVGFSDDR